MKHKNKSFFIATLLCCAGQGAVAQVMSTISLPDVNLQDRNGVDLKTGKIILHNGLISIGPVDNPDLSFEIAPSFVDRSAGTPLIGRIYSTYCPNGVTSIPNGCYVEYHAQLGNRDINFGWAQAAGWASYPAVTSRGFRLDKETTGYVVTEKDGTKWYFKSAPDTNNPYTASIDHIIYPDGKRLDYYAYGIVSNTGYELHFGNKNNPGHDLLDNATLINLSVDYCDPTAATCDKLTKTWPTVYTVPQSVSGAVSAYGYADTLGRTTKIALFSVSSTEARTVITSPAGMSLTYDYEIHNNTSIGTSANVIKYVTSADGTTNYAYTFDRYMHIITASSTSPSGAVTAYSLNLQSPYKDGDISPSPYTQTITDPNGHARTLGFAKYQSQNSYWPEEGALTSVYYPEGNGISSFLNDRGQEVSFKYNQKTGYSPDYFISTNNYENCDNWVSCSSPSYVLDKNGNRTDFTYDQNTGLMLSKTEPANSDGVRAVTNYTYNKFSAYYQISAGVFSYSAYPVWKLVSESACLNSSPCEGTPSQTVTEYSYDGNLRLVKKSVRSGDGTNLLTTLYYYDDVGNVTSVDGPMPGTFDTTNYFYDDARQKVGIIKPKDLSTDDKFQAERYSYDMDGRMVMSEAGYTTGTNYSDLSNMNVQNWVKTSYDSMGRKYLSYTGSGSLYLTANQFSYDADGNLICSAQRLNAAAFTSLPASACTLGTAGSYGPDRVTKNVYDAAGQLIQVRKAVGTPLEQAYATYSYTKNGKQEYVIDANGNQAKFEYDGFDRQVKWIFPSTARAPAYNPGLSFTDGATVLSSALNSAGGINAADYEQYGYDANGNRTSLRKRDGSTIGYTFDALNRMIVKTVPERTGLAATHTRDVYYGYDLQGHQTYARFDSASGEGLANVWDALGRLTSTTQSIDGASRTLSYQYDADGNRTRVTFPDGNYVSYSYDGLDRPLLIQRNGVATLASYTYDAAGRRIGFTNGSGGAIATSYGYDGIGRVTSMANTPQASAYINQYTFGYNAASQITSLTRSNDAYTFTGATSRSLDYATNGLNQYTALGSAGLTYDANGNLTSDESNTYTFDVENRLVAIAGKSGAKNAKDPATLRYDPLGRLYEIAGASGTTRFLNDGDALVAEYNSAGSLLRRYAHGADIAADDPIAWYEGADFTSATERMLRPDWQGSIVLTTDSTGANPIAINTYDEYGMPGGTNVGRFQYTGQAWLKEVGMYYYKARIYSPMLGRFLQTDPIGYKDQINLYAYVGNDPVNKFDYSGQEIVDYNANTRARIAAFINSKSKVQYKFDGNGVLSKDKSSPMNSKGSNYFSSQINRAISGKEKIDVDISPTLTYSSGVGPLRGGGAKYTVGVDAVGGGGLTSPDGHTVRISGNSSVDHGVNSSPAQILVHELAGHAIPLLYGGGTGNAISDENIIRRENGAPLRPADPSHTECQNCGY